MECLFTRFRQGKAAFAYGGKFSQILKITGIVVFWLADFGYALYRNVGEKIDLETSVIAHSFGTVTGFLLGFIILKNIKVARWEKTCKVVCYTTFFFLMGLAFGVNITGSRRATGIISAKTCYSAKLIRNCSYSVMTDGVPDYLTGW
jgi:hypothetical protein